ncbi:MAG: tetratricopeptide repeat protein, partial [Planctomycetota bacterium]
GLLLAAALLLPRYEGRRRAASRATLPFFIVALAPVAVHLLVGVEKGVVREAAEPGVRILSGISAWGWSIYKTILPYDLSVDYPEARVESLGRAILPGLLLCGALAAAFALRRRAPVVSFGIAAFFVALAPFNDLFPATDVFMADRYLYLSLFGLAAVAAWAAARWESASVATGIATFVLALLSMLSASRWVSDEVLWTRTIEGDLVTRGRDASALAYFNRGAARFGAGRSEEALEDLERALTRSVLREHRLKSHALAEVRLLGGAPREALEQIEDALVLVEEIDTAEARAFEANLLLTRGGIHVALGNILPAALDYRAAARLKPTFEASLESGRAFLATGRLPEAEPMLERAAKIDRSRPEPHLELARLHGFRGDRQSCRMKLEDAAARAPTDIKVVEAWVRFWLDTRSPDPGKARKELDRLPKDSPARRSLEAKVEAETAIYHFRRGNRAEAVAAAERARALGLKDPATLYDLGHVYLAGRRYDDAVECFLTSADVLEGRRAQKDAVSRAYVLKAYALLSSGDSGGAARAMRAALDVRPEQLEAGAVALRGELALLRAAEKEELMLLAVATVAGDPAHGERITNDLLASDGLSESDRSLAHRLRGLLRAFVTYDFEGAEDDLNEVLARNPDDRWARFRLGQAWALSGSGWMRTADQLKSAERLAQGEALVKRAIQLFDRLIEESPDFLLARLQRGECYFALGDRIGAKNDYAHVRERAPALKEVFVKEAALHRLVYVTGGDRRNLDSAIEILDQALALDPNFLDALFELGNAYHLIYDRQDEPAASRKMAFLRAILWYRRAMALNPRARAPRLEWARICLKAGQEALAGDEVRRAHELIERVEADAGDIYAETHKSRVRINMRPDFGERTGLSPDAIFEGAARALDKLRKMTPGDPDLAALEALYHRRRGYSFYWSWVKLREAAHKERARELAVQEWRKALEAWPGDPENGAVRSRLKEIAPEFIAIDQEAARKAFEAAEKDLREGRHEAAAEGFAEALRLFPESLDIRYLLATALARTGRLDAAGPHFERVANSPDGGRFPGAMYELGNIFQV